MNFNYPYYAPYMAPQPNPAAFQPPQRPEMMQGYPQPPQMAQTAPQPQIQGYFVRPVTNREEAVAAQIDFLSPGTFMPDFNNGRVYFKRLNSQTGSCDFMTFVLEQPDKPESAPTAPEYATVQDLREMQQVIQGLAADIDSLRAPARGGKRVAYDE